MTHDELLYKIEEEASYYTLTLVMKAVVELHKCIEQTTGISYTSENGLEILETQKICGYCSKDGWEVYYPCKTIQTIEKELG